MYAIVAGGGTGGHVYPAIAIADALVERGHERSDIHFVGSRRTLESTVVPQAGYSITLLSGRGIKRKLSIDNIGAVAGLLLAFVRALVLLVMHRPRVVVSVGGYAAAPAVFAAIVLRVPLVLAESNAVPGAVHRLASRFAKASAVAWPNTPLPRAVVTGNPVRSDLAHLQRSPEARQIAREKLGLPQNGVVVASFGGSLGATNLNRAIVGLVDEWTDRSDVAIYHVVGKRDWKDASLHAVLPSGAKLAYTAVEYENDMPSLYLAADLLISRSGATTSAEIAAVGIASLLVPLPGAPGDHQTANARVMQKVDAAIVLADRDCTGDRLAKELQPLLGDPSRLIEMGEAAKALAQADAAQRVAELVEEAAIQRKLTT